MKTILRIFAALAMTFAMALASSGSAQASPPTQWLSVSTGFASTCGITANHSLYCWGYNQYGGLGVNDINPRFTPTKVGADSDWAKVVVGSYHACAIKTSGSLYCWGYNGEGALGVGDTDPHLTPAKVGVSTQWASVTAGEDHTCALKKDHSLYCWGYNHDGQLGLNDFDDRHAPVRVGASTKWTSISAGLNFSCALHSSGSIYCWGLNDVGSLGVGDFSPRKTPAKVGVSTSWSSVSAGGEHACARTKSGSMYCWGAGSYGQLGLGADVTNRKSPKKVGTSTSWTSVDAGAYHPCARYKSGSLYCWGNGENGRLGLGSDLGNRGTPKKVGTSTAWLSVQAGGLHTCAKHSTGAIYCWGWNLYGQLGINDDSPKNKPTKVA